jgi:hypothetical protein
MNLPGCRSMMLMTLVYSATTVASDHQDSLVRGLWSLTAQADPIVPNDLRRTLGIQPDHYTQESGNHEPWQFIFHLKPQYSSVGATDDSITDFSLGLGEFIVLEGPPHDVATRQKVKIAFQGNACVTAKSFETMMHIMRTESETPQFKTVNGRMQSTLELDGDCATNVQITKLLVPPPLR